MILQWWSMRNLVFKCFKELRKCVANIILLKNIRSHWDPSYIETFQKCLMITVIFVDFHTISPLMNSMVTHRTWKSCDFFINFCIFSNRSPCSVQFQNFLIVPHLSESIPAGCMGNEQKNSNVFNHDMHILLMLTGWHVSFWQIKASALLSTGPWFVNMWNQKTKSMISSSLIILFYYNNTHNWIWIRFILWLDTLNCN